jgi:hypothetical protein
MIVAVLAAIAGLVAVLIATHHPYAGLEPPAAPEPEWDPLPAPNDVARPDFPLAFPGYDPASVEAAIEALLVAYEELYAAAAPEARERAHRAAARRRGRGPPAPPERKEPPHAALPAAGGSPMGPPDLDEALRAAAALDAIARSQ